MSTTTRTNSPKPWRPVRKAWHSAVSTAGRIQVGKTLHLMAKICRATALKTGSEQHYNEALSYIQEAVQIFRETGSRLLPEAEATLRELHELHGSQNAE